AGPSGRNGPASTRRASGRASGIRLGASAAWPASGARGAAAEPPQPNIHRTQITPVGRACIGWTAYLKNGPYPGRPQKPRETRRARDTQALLEGSCVFLPRRLVSRACWRPGVLAVASFF